MRKQQTGHLLFKELRKTANNQVLSTKEKVEALYRLLSLSFVEATRDEKVLFTTLFARISFASQRYQISKQNRFFIHHFRINGQKVLRSKKVNQHTLEKVYYPLGLKAVSESITALFEIDIPNDLQQLLPSKYTIEPQVVSSTSQPKSKIKQLYPLLLILSGILIISFWLFYS